MVNVFIVHSGTDYDYVKTSVEPYLLGQIDEQGQPASRESNANILTLESGKESRWKNDASRKIKMAQVVIVVIGKDAADPSKIDTMGWEVQRALKFNKQIMVVNPDQNEIPSFLYQTDRFTKMQQLIAPQQSLEQIKKRIDDYAAGYYNIFSDDYLNLSDEEKASHYGEYIDQYKMFQKTSEDLVTRRQNVNSFYISVNSAIVALAGIVMGVIDVPTKYFVVLFMCISGIILDVSWIHILDAYGTLNAAKLKVISLMEMNLPVALYDAEWQIMSDKLNNKKYVSFTSSEKRIPKIFLFVFVIIIIFMSCLLLIHYSS